MGALAKQRDNISHTKETVDLVLAHFDSQKIDLNLAKKIGAAANLAFSDRLLFEKFELWNQERDDEVFIYHVRRFFEKRDHPPLLEHERNVTKERESIEHSIKTNVRERQKKIFSERITLLAVQHGLLTNEQLGAFLNVSDEQARKYKSGENKPQLTTLHDISKKFNVSPGYLMGLE